MICDIVQHTTDLLCSFSDRQIINVKSIQLGKLKLYITLVNATRWKINLIYTENFIYSANCFRLSYQVIYFSLRCNGKFCCFFLLTWSDQLFRVFQQVYNLQLNMMPNDGKCTAVDSESYNFVECRSHCNHARDAMRLCNNNIEK